MDRVPSVSFGIPRIATCRGCPEAFEAFSGSQRWCASAIGVALVNAIGGRKKAPKSVSGLHGSHLQFQACFLRLPKMVCEGNLKWGTANAIGVALVDLRMQSSTPAVVPGAALPRPRLGRVGGYTI